MTDTFLLDLKQSSAEKAPPSNDPYYPLWCTTWGISEVHLSISASCAVVRPRMAWKLDDASGRNECKKELGTLLRYFANLIGEYGLLLPCAGIVLLDANHLKEIQQWAGDQDWHRGDFLLFAESNETAMKQRRGDLLSGQPPEWTAPERLQVKTAKEVLSRVESHDLLLHVRANLDNVSPLDASSDASLQIWVNGKLKAIDPRFFWAPEAPDKKDEEGKPSAEPSTIRLADTIERISQVRIRNFRGFSGLVELNVDADLVLLVGPNGLGKTSVIEALDLLLTGNHHFDSSKPGRSPHQLFHGKALDFLVEADVHFRQESGSPAGGINGKISVKGERTAAPENENAPAVRLEWEVTNGGSVQHADVLIRPLSAEYMKLFSETPIEASGRAAELLSRRTAVYPDRLDDLFDETSTGSTVRGYLEPVVPLIERLLSHLTDPVHGIPKTLADARNRLIQEKDVRVNIPELQSACDAALLSLSPHYAGLSADDSWWPPLPASFDDGTLVDFALKLFNRTGKSADPTEIPGKIEGLLIDLCEEELKKLEQDARGGSGPWAWGIQRDIEHCQSELEVIEKEYPDLDRDLERFSGDPGLLRVFEALRDNATRWTDVGGMLERHRQQLGGVLSELRRVQPNDAAKCAAELRAYLEPLDATQKRRRKIEEEMEDLLRRLRVARISERAAKLEALRLPLSKSASDLAQRWSEYHKGLDSIEKAKQAADRLTALEGLEKEIDSAAAALVEASRPSAALQNTIETLANHVFARFASAENVRLKLKPLDITRDIREADTADRRRYFKLTTSDGRPVPVLSFGQRTQVGVAMVVAENRLLQEKIGHRVFLMDDLSATYDLANLTRDSIWWRQMAYGAAQDSESRRQVFFSSHHEDLSNRLLDLMVPVEPSRMLVHKFTRWSAADGPLIETSEVEAQSAFDDDEKRKDLADWMAEQLKDNVHA